MAKVPKIKNVAPKVKMPAGKLSSAVPKAPKGPAGPQMSTMANNFSPYKAASRLPKGGF